MAIHDPNAPAWERKGTLFDPDKVVIPRQYAKRFNYKNRTLGRSRSSTDGA